ncbi:unnamed protein product [Ilex paraguariensis]|uniref:Uncharacterized protein n=1 Tax=Ilex paraguariensis TaxID=185542 RepID=A0ABC8UAT1_9AQUA
MAVEAVPSRTRTLLFLVIFMVITAILLLSMSNSTTVSSGKEGKNRKQEEDNDDRNLVRCLRHLFGPLPPPPKDEIGRTLASMDHVLCRETIHDIGYDIRASGKIPHYLIEEASTIQEQ